MYERGLTTKDKTPLVFEREEKEKEGPTDVLARDTTTFDSDPDEDYQVRVLKLKPYECKQLVINGMGATGEGYMQLEDRSLFTGQLKTCLTLNFKNGKLKQSTVGRVEQDL